MKTYVKEWVDALGYTKDDLSKATGISVKVMDSWFSGKMTPSLTQLSLIGNELDLDLDELVFMDPTKMPKYMIEGIGGEIPVYKTIMDMEDPGSQLNVKLFIQEWMDKKDLTAEIVNTHTGIPIDVIGQWGKNLKNPTIYQAKVLADMMEITINDLMVDPDEKILKANSEKGGAHIIEISNHIMAGRIYQYLKKKGYESDLVIVKYPGKNGTRLGFLIFYWAEYPISNVKLLLSGIDPRNKTPEESLGLEYMINKYDTLE